MTRLYLVRHGRAAAGFDVADPALDEVGRTQAESVAKELAGFGPLPILTSPLRRTRETAQPLARVWKREPRVEPAIAEIPTPQHLDVTTRVPWLRRFMTGSWRAADSALATWRESVIATLLAQPEDAVLFSHFIAINVVVGEATGDRRVVCFQPDNASRTVVDVEDGSVRIWELGHQADTVVG